MTYDQYWLDDPWIFSAYRHAEKLKSERLEYSEWRTGAYVYEALCRAAPMLNPFMEKNDPLGWIEEPYGVSAKRTGEDDEASRKEAAQRKLREYALSMCGRTAR